jgi:hypothetical protein
MDPRASMDAVAKRENPYTCRGSKPSCPARSLVTMLTELPRTMSSSCFLVLAVFSLRAPIPEKIRLLDFLEM